ncbi:MAG: hypothetical protein CM15mP49_15240 [Actinomycetota bacterium]|nr:MAG: hypothetical protein CM15mP49_15240 [Actinomycetota bacterium]
MLADLGANVVLVEPINGSSLRETAPFGPNGESLGFLWRNANKSGISIDFNTESGSQQLLTLLSEADVWLEDGSPLGDVMVDAVIKNMPALVVTSITPFGYTGPYADLIANDDVLEAMSGMMFKAGISSKDPLLPPTRWRRMLLQFLLRSRPCLPCIRRCEQGQGSTWIWR